MTGAAGAPSDLASRAREVARRALRSGALVPLPTRRTTLEDGGVRFVVRVLEALDDKRTAGLAARTGGRNPFLPYDERLHVASLPPRHEILLNKFRVVDLHLLVVTRAFEPQEAPLAPDDLGALWACLQVLDGLGFYNSGTVAGASQPHRHLQLVAAPLGDGPERYPLETRYADETARRALPWACAVRAVRDLGSARAGETLHARWASALSELGEDPGNPGPYNLLLTRELLVVVPRRRESWEGISINALGFAGSLLVRDDAQLARLRDAGPMRALTATGRRYGRR
ncbi:MAG: ATP adenylyltransferase [Acidobacteriota bacterium]